MSGEFDRIARHFAPLAAAAALGLADDAAVWTPPAGRELVLTVDQMVENVHFLPEDPADLVARKLLRRNLSDLAAMGAAPVGYLLTTALRADTPESWLAAFAAGLAADQATYGIELFGGDSTSTPGPLMTSVTMFGTVAPGDAWRRNGARPGDAILVTGTIGDAVLGLEAVRGTIADPTGFLRQRRLLPEPRIGLPIGSLVHAAIDISDGLVQDLTHLCRAAGIGATIEAARLPTSEAARALGPATLETRLAGGDDYELILAAHPDDIPAIAKACTLIQITRIGTFTPTPTITILDPHGAPMTLATTGWQHFWG